MAAVEAVAGLILLAIAYFAGRVLFTERVIR
jgi:hypothetical protein